MLSASRCIKRESMKGGGVHNIGQTNADISLSLCYKGKICLCSLV